MTLRDFIRNMIAFIGLIGAVVICEEYKSGFWIFAVYSLLLHFYACAIAERDQLREKLRELNETEGKEQK